MQSGTPSHPITSVEALVAGLQALGTIAPKPVTVPVLGTVFVRALSTAELQAMGAQPTDAGNSIARNICRVLCTAQGQRLLDPDNAEHVALVNAAGWPAMRLIAEAAQKLNGDDDAKND